MGSHITWKDYYSVGDEALDAQHKQVLAAINELYDAMQGGVDYRAVAPLLDRLVQYTITHFRQEEERMAAHEYPEFAQHKALHDTMRQKTIALREYANVVTGRDLLVFLKEWWCNHIQDQDKKYAPYLKVPVKV
jgi:hemerythrin-like metal-binding protein